LLFIHGRDEVIEALTFKRVEMKYKTSESWADTYPASWHKFQVTRWCFWLMLIFMPAVPYVVISIPAPENLKGYVLLAIPLYLIAWIGLGIAIDFWHCPRCHKRFSYSTGNEGLPRYYNPLTRLVILNIAPRIFPPSLPPGMNAAAKKELQAQYMHRKRSESNYCNNCGLPMRKESSDADKLSG
jgi:hypothetical protein